MKTSLPLKSIQKKGGASPVGSYRNHSLSVIHREGSGEAELPETQGYIFIVQSGEGPRVLGGKMVDAKTTMPHEVRGPSISDGASKQIGPGDIGHIAAQTPYQVIVPAGKQVTYAIVKVNAE